MTPGGPHGRATTGPALPLSGMDTTDTGCCSANPPARACSPGKAAIQHPHLPLSGVPVLERGQRERLILAVVLDLSSIDLEEIANALADQTDYEHHWLINPDTGEIAFWTADTGIDGQTPVDLDELDLVVIDPLPSWVWYQDMADFADGITDERAGRRLARAIQGKGAFRRFKDELHEEHPDLLPAWYAFRDHPRQAPGRAMAG